MRRSGLIFSVLGFLLSSASYSSDLFGVGQRNYQFEDAARNRSLAAVVWYPVGPHVKRVPLARKRDPFLPVVSALNAPPVSVPKKFPLVLLSHGSGGTKEKLFWFAEYFVRRGAVALAVDHPGNKTGNNSGRGMVYVWDRPKDLSFVLDRLLEIKEFQTRIDLNKVSAVGHSAGGTTALLLGGARLSSAKLVNPVPHCKGTQDPFFAEICEQVGAIDFKALPKEAVEADYFDPRVKAVVALDPGFARSFDVASLKNTKAKLRLFLADRLQSPHDQIYSKDFTKLLPATDVKTVPDSFHMTFLQACKPGFPKDDPELRDLCVKNDSRLAAQEKVAEESWEFLNSP